MTVLEPSVGAILDRTYKRYATRPAIVDPNQGTSFATLQQRVYRTANALLALGLIQGDRVLIWLENIPEFLELEQAVFISGFVRTAVSSRLHVREVIDLSLIHI